MKKIPFSIFFLLLCICISSCTTHEVSSDLNGQQLTVAKTTPVGHINTDLYGYYLFNTWPLITGDPNSSAGFSLFTDTITEENALAAMTQKAKEMGATKVTNVKSAFDNTGVFTFWISWYKCYQVSGNAVK